MKKGKETVKFLILYQRLTKVTLVPGKETTRNHIWNFDHQEAYPGFRSWNFVPANKQSHKTKAVRWRSECFLRLLDIPAR